MSGGGAEIRNIHHHLLPLLLVVFGEVRHPCPQAAVVRIVACEIERKIERCNNEVDDFNINEI